MRALIPSWGPCLHLSLITSKRSFFQPKWLNSMVNVQSSINLGYLIQFTLYSGHISLTWPLNYPFPHSLLWLSFLYSFLCPWSLNSSIFYVSIFVLLLYIPTLNLIFYTFLLRWDSQIWIYNLDLFLNSRFLFPLLTCDLHLISNDILKSKYELLIYPRTLFLFFPISINSNQSISKS